MTFGWPWFMRSIICNRHSEYQSFCRMYVMVRIGNAKNITLCVTLNIHEKERSFEPYFPFLFILYPVGVRPCFLPFPRLQIQTIFTCFFILYRMVRFWLFGTQNNTCIVRPWRLGTVKCLPNAIPTKLPCIIYI